MRAAPITVKVTIGLLHTLKITREICKVVITNFASTSKILVFLFIIIHDGYIYTPTLDNLVQAYRQLEAPFNDAKTKSMATNQLDWNQLNQFC